MDDIDSQLVALLRGEFVPLPSSLTEGASVTYAYQPRLKQNVSYIVSAVVIDEQGKVLLMQEAKPECYGLWYLPAGRMEKHEHMVDAVKREVKEETGLEFEPQTLLSVELSTCWYRFTFTGKVKGKLKSVPDEESLSAGWFIYEDVIENNKVELRSSDICSLVTIGKQYVDVGEAEQHDHVMPNIEPYSHIHLRLVIFHKKPDSGGYLVITDKKPPIHFPCGVVSVEDYSTQLSVNRLLQNIFPKFSEDAHIHGLLAVDFQGEPSSDHKFGAPYKEGMCLTFLLSLQSNNDLDQAVGVTDAIPINTEDYVWKDYTNVDLVKALLDTKVGKGKTPNVRIIG